MFRDLLLILLFSLSLVGAQTSASGNASLSTVVNSTSNRTLTSIDYTISLTSSTPSPSQIPPTCPDSKGTTFTTPSGSQYIIECDVDHQAGDIVNGMQYVDSLEACISACDASTVACVDVSLYGGRLELTSRLLGSTDHFGQHHAT